MEIDLKPGVRELAEYLILMAVDRVHNGELCCDDIVEAAMVFGVKLDAREVINPTPNWENVRIYAGPQAN